MVTAVALFPVEALREHPPEVRAPIRDELEPRKKLVVPATADWDAAMAPLATMRLADERLQRLYDLAIANLVLHAPDEIYPGPYTYKRFWFRDAAFMLNAKPESLVGI